MNRRDLFGGASIALLAAGAGAGLQGYIEERRDDRHSLQVILTSPYLQGDHYYTSVRYTNSGNVSETSMRATILIFGNLGFKVDHCCYKADPMIVSSETTVDLRMDQSEDDGLISFKATIERLTPGDTIEIIFRATEGEIAGLQADIQSADTSNSAEWGRTTLL
jgi:hypothetical protein